LVIHFEPLFTKSEFFKSYACSRQLSAEGANFRVARHPPRVIYGRLAGAIGWPRPWLVAAGYLLPRLLQRYSPLTSALVLGVIWEVWHFPLYYHTFLHDFHETASFTIGIMGLSLLITVLFI
jgi:hypothetical protein